MCRQASERCHTGQKPILNNVPTWKCEDRDALAYVLDHLDELVVKEVHGAGGYGMLLGPAASKKERADFARKLKIDAAELRSLFAGNRRTGRSLAPISRRMVRTSSSAKTRASTARDVGRSEATRSAPGSHGRGSNGGERSVQRMLVLVEGRQDVLDAVERTRRPATMAAN